MKKEDTADKTEPSGSPTLSENGRTPTRKLVTAKAPYCFTHDVDFRNVVKGHELGFREDLSEIVDLALPDSPYSIGRV